MSKLSQQLDFYLAELQLQCNEIDEANHRIEQQKLKQAHIKRKQLKMQKLQEKTPDIQTSSKAMKLMGRMEEKVEEKPRCEGFLYKQTSNKLLKRWKQRYFVLKRNVLTSFRDKNDTQVLEEFVIDSTARLSMLTIAEQVEGECFVLQKDGIQWHLACSNGSTAQWFKEIRSVIDEEYCKDILGSNRQVYIPSMQQIIDAIARYSTDNDSLKRYPSDSSLPTLSPTSPRDNARFSFDDRFSFGSNQAIPVQPELLKVNRSVGNRGLVAIERFERFELY